MLEGGWGEYLVPPQRFRSMCPTWGRRSRGYPEGLGRPTEEVSSDLATEPSQPFWTMPQSHLVGHMPLNAYGNAAIAAAPLGSNFGATSLKGKLSFFALYGES